MSIKKTPYGTGTNGDLRKPVWLTPDEAAATTAETSGWVYAQPGGQGMEVLVAIKGAPKGLVNAVAADITAVTLAASYTELLVGQVTVTFDEAVDVVGFPTIVLTSDAGPLVATYVSGTGTTDLVFEFDAPVAPDEITVGGQMVQGGTITAVDAGPVNRTITEAVAAATVPAPVVA